MDKNNDKRLIEAAKLIQEHCCTVADCQSCIFNSDGSCMFTCEQYVYTNDYAPHNWDIPAIREE